MRVSIYNEPRGSGIGGSEFVAALLGETFAKEHQVDLFHRIPSLTAENSRRIPALLEELAATLYRLAGN